MYSHHYRCRADLRVRRSTSWWPYLRDHASDEPIEQGRNERCRWPWWSVAVPGPHLGRRSTGPFPAHGICCRHLFDSSNGNHWNSWCLRSQDTPPSRSPCTACIFRSHCTVDRSSCFPDRYIGI